MIQIRLASSSDAPAIAGLCDQLGYPTTVEQAHQRLEALLSRPDHAIFVALDAAGQVTGWIHLHGTHHLQAEPYAEIGGLVVDAAHTGQGIGAVLVQHGESWVIAQGYPQLRVRSNVIRAEAHKFYLKHGYSLHKSQHVFVKSFRPA